MLSRPISSAPLLAIVASMNKYSISQRFHPDEILGQFQTCREGELPLVFVILAAFEAGGNGEAVANVLAPAGAAETAPEF